MKPKATKLPSRKVMLDLSKSQQRITDYAKASPSTATDQYSTIVQTLKKKKDA